MSVVQILSLHRNRLDYLSLLEPFTSEFYDWYSETQKMLSGIFGEKSKEFVQFKAVRVYQASEVFTSEEQRTSRYQTSIKGLAAVLSTAEFYAGNPDFQSLRLDSSIVTKSHLETVKLICGRFHQVAKQLLNRHGGRETLKITDEYDVQDLLHALLRLHFDDVRDEEWTPSYAGGASRMDFLLKKEEIVIEVKKMRVGLGKKEVGEQLLIDIARYKAHPNCAILVCLVYDPEELLQNPSGITNDLNKKHDDLEVIVIISSKAS